MNILWISLYPPLPLDFGGAIGIHKRLIEIRKCNRVFLFYLNDDGNKEYDNELYKLCEDVHSYKRNTLWSFETFKNLFKYPYTAATRKISRMEIDILECIEKKNIDLVNIDFPQMCINVLNIIKYINLPIVLNEHNNEWKRFEQMSLSVKGIKKILYKRESRLLYKFEKEIESKCIISLYTFVSDKDYYNFQKEFKVSEEKLKLIPVGADSEYVTSHIEEKNSIMFCGAMDSMLNEEAVLWFVNKVFPHILQDVPDAKFYIVGRNPSKTVTKLQRENIIVTGTVQNVSDYYKRCKLVVIPLLHGGGVKVKLLEAVGYGKNIVSTTVGIEGTSFDSKTQIPVEDSPEKFAKTCINILDDNYYAECLKLNTDKYFRENYTWDAIGKKYNSVLEDLCKNK